MYSCLPARRRPSGADATDAPDIRYARIELPGGGADLFASGPSSRARPPQFRSGITIGVIESGSALLRFPDCTKTLERDGVFRIPAGRVFSIVPRGSEALRYTLVQVDAPFASLARASAGLDAWQGQDIDPDAARFLHAIGRALASTEGSDMMAPPECPPAYSPLVDSTRRTLEAHVTSRVRISALATAHQMSTFRLIRAFRREIGLPPYAYVHQHRINHARDRLRAGDSISSVAYTCCFSDQSHLTRDFKRHFGIPPGEYLRAFDGASRLDVGANAAPRAELHLV